ncbi:hypothetical protein CVV68_00370 [Arthrobacter livingstonensis]|uniref:Uncharacterized protein n=1 Tax=Arthrobacter livingstonensis TaxID=670078 RepID=A0A2V5LFP6_9MICC|nr:hypothetical protein CVV68_00370 [Arthrobacter livingstonensis]
MVVSGVVLLGGGIWLGTAVTDPTASEEYAALDATAQTAQQDLARTLTDRQAVSDELDSLKSELTTREEAADAKSTAAGQHEADVKTAEAALKTREAAVKKREDAVTGAEKAKAANTVGDGTWTVGVDVAPGTYRAKADVGSTCYWGIYRTGSNGDDIINNDIPGGGRPSVVLSAGQDFNSTRCGSWEKQ